MGPPSTVKIASPIPTQSFAPLANAGPIMHSLAQVPMMFQQHTGSPTALLPGVVPGALAGPVEYLNPIHPQNRWQPIIQSLRDFLSNYGKARPYTGA